MWRLQIKQATIIKACTKKHWRTRFVLVARTTTVLLPLIVICALRFLATKLFTTCPQGQLAPDEFGPTTRFQGRRSGRLALKNGENGGNAPRATRS
mmetsp:Transcript_26708/g.62099  ORF Transcript_26708/g.62099 Transcript_26708/m.62099 type:complete len:96 (-) Transcript_26708:224-511(-)